MSTPSHNPQPNPTTPPDINHQPVTQAPAANYHQPTQAEQQTPYNQQPVQQQYFAQPHAAPVQYVVQAQSLKGVRGWLGFFMVIAGLLALSFTGMLITATTNFESSLIADVIMLPLMIGAAIASVATIAMEKKIARLIYIGFGAILLLYSILSSAVRGAEAETIIGSILTGGLWLTFVALYFVTSKRVKETLVK